MIDYGDAWDPPPDKEHPDPPDMDGLFERPERRVRMLRGAVPARPRMAETVTVRGELL